MVECQGVEPRGLSGVGFTARCSRQCCSHSEKTKGPAAQRQQRGRAKTCLVQVGDNGVGAHAVAGSKFLNHACHGRATHGTRCSWSHRRLARTARHGRSSCAVPAFERRHRHIENGFASVHFGVRRSQSETAFLQPPRRGTSSGTRTPVGMDCFIRSSGCSPRRPIARIASADGISKPAAARRRSASSPHGSLIGSRCFLAICSCASAIRYAHITSIAAVAAFGAVRCATACAVSTAIRRARSSRLAPISGGLCSSGHVHQRAPLRVPRPRLVGDSVPGDVGAGLFARHSPVSASLDLWRTVDGHRTFATTPLAYRGLRHAELFGKRGLASEVVNGPLY